MRNNCWLISKLYYIGFFKLRELEFCITVTLCFVNLVKILLVLLTVGEIIFIFLFTVEFVIVFCFFKIRSPW